MIDTLPALPLDDGPVDMTREPDEPDALEPLPIATEPLGPDAPSPVSIDTEPLPDADAPLVSDTSPD